MQIVLRLLNLPGHGINKDSMSDDGQVFLQGSQIEDGTDANMTRLADRLTTLITQRNALIDNKGMSIKDAALRVSVSLTGNRSGEVRFTYGKVLNVCKRYRYGACNFG